MCAAGGRSLVLEKLIRRKVSSTMGIKFYYKNTG